MTIRVSREVREVIRDDILQGQQQRSILSHPSARVGPKHARVSEAPRRVRSECHGIASGMRGLWVV